MTLDMWNPNNWEIKEHEYRIYADDKAIKYAVVDEIDYHYLIQWKWSIKYSKRGKKFYLRRSTHEGSRKSRTVKTLFLHTVVMERTGVIKPSPLHFLVDHRDSDSMNNRRSNLRWATPSMNCKNINGKHGDDNVLCVVEESIIEDTTELSEMA